MTSTVRFNHPTPEHNLDALLEDLQTTVSGTKANGIANGHAHSHPSAPGVTSTGYKEVIRQTATQRDGQPVESNREYHIEYLNPANTTTVLRETHSPTFNMLDKSDLSSSNKGQQMYKSVSYQYNTSSDSSTLKDVSTTKTTDSKLRQNINELDHLLDDITLAQKTGFANSGPTYTSSPKTGYSEIREKIESSNAPRSKGHVSRIEERTFEEQRYGTVLPPRTDSEARRELKFVGNSSRDGSLNRTIRDQSPSPVRHKEVFYQESRHTSSGRSRENRSPSPIRNANLIATNTGKVASTVKSYDYRSQSTRTADEIGQRLRERTPSPTTVSPVPVLATGPGPMVAGPPGSKQIIRYDYEKTTTRSVSPPRVIHHYDYQSTSSSSNEKTSYSPRPPSPTKIQSSQYEYQKTTSNVKEKPRTPPPHRSPSPVSFAQPPDPHIVSTYSSFEQGVNRSASPLPTKPTVITYKYESTSTESRQYPPTVTHHYEVDESSKFEQRSIAEKPRPFPVTEADKLPTPGPQEPPKRVEELMASFSESDYQKYMALDQPDAPKPKSPTPPPPAPVGPAVNPAPQANGTVGKSKNLAGPPVYYPPGELFTAKEAASMQQSAGGKMKGKMMAKYKYKEGGKHFEKSGTTTIPVCLPLCCAAPCVIM